MSETETAAPSGLPSVEDLLQEAVAKNDVAAAAQRDAEDDYDETIKAQSIKNETAYAHLKGVQDHYANKTEWSGFLRNLLCGMIAFQWLLLALVGFGIWDFTKYQWLLPILLVQNLGQIIGLAVIVVRSLFKDIAPKQ
ncbi:hypothetical protein [Paenirhodobacter hankyongi]|uniref:hypothetical protein n=1 Tax=Paenirhodobacter hankyongi TaxID=2294033 RepID=UPI0011C36C22|nr:hypothetical protein [Sinirhodobacter hankyongi]